MSRATTGPFDQLLRAAPVPQWNSVAWPLLAVIVVFLVWANFAQLDEVAVATGEVVPQGKVKVIQHLEGGIIERIDVVEGDRVRTGQPLALLDLGASGVNRNELQVRLDNLLLSKERLTAEVEERPLDFSAGLIERRPTQVQAERANYQARKEQLTSTLSVLENQISQRELEVQELEARYQATRRNLELGRERLAMSESLLEKNLTPKMEHLNLEAEVEELQGERRTLERTIPKARAAAEEARDRVAEAKAQFRREAREELGVVEQNIARLRELLAEATEQGLRAEIKSPIEGVVKNMRYHTIGGVVSPGEPIMEIVPTGEMLVIEARLNPVDRGYVREGQPATVKISSYDFARYGGLEGTVAMVAPDSSADERGQPFFRVVAKTEKTYLGAKAGELPIMPGMEASVEIHTGERTVMEYLVRPVLKLRHEAFRER